MSFAAALSLSGWGWAQVPAAAQANPVAAPAADRPWHVVILNDSDPTLPAFIALDRAMRAALTAPGRHPVNMYYETLDQVRFPQAQIDGELVALMAKKYAAMRVDAVIAIGATSLDFAEKHRSHLWPDARIVYTGVPVELLQKRQLGPTTTGVTRRYELAGTVDLALGLRPTTRRLVVIAGSGDFDRIMADLARTQLERYTNRLTIEYLVETSIDDFHRRIAQLDSNDAALYLSIGRDSDGRTFAPREVLKQLSVVSKAPIYGSVETFIGHGIVAGAVYSFEDRGKRVGDLVQDVLSIPPGTALPPASAGAALCMADANELERLGMDAGRLPPGCEVRNARPSLWREYRWYVLGTLMVVLGQAGLIVALILQRRGRRKAEDDARHHRAELEQASRLALAGELAASIAHEINQPLGAILANAGAAEALLRRGATSSDEFRAIIADIKQADLRAGEVIRHVRALVATHEVEREVIDVNVIIRDVLAFLHGEAERRGVVVDVVPASDLPPVLADRVQLQQAFVNLCVNAFDAMNDTAASERCFGVRTQIGPDGLVEVTIRDTGPGIPADQLPRLFDSFFTTKVDGMGMGLSISRSIIDVHGGTLSAENRDRGALFRILLPPHHGREAAPSRTSASEVASSPPPIHAGTIAKGLP